MVIPHRAGAILAVLGGLVAGLSYLVIPVAQVPLVGQATAPALNDAVSEYHSLALLPFVPIAAVLTLVAGLWLLATAGARWRRPAAIGILACSAYALVAYFIPFFALQKSITDIGASNLGVNAATFTGSGFWVAVIGALIAAGGGALELGQRG